jgi:crotonobetainyl-CoA:carnitine CoA-transferase CaiB-like acyl-CoA transferase
MTGIAYGGMLFTVSPDPEQPRNALLNQYRAGDGKWIGLAAINARAWPHILAAVKLEHIACDSRFATFADAVANARAMRELLDEHFATEPAHVWLERVRAGGVWRACEPH